MGMPTYGAPMHPEIRIFHEKNWLADPVFEDNLYRYYDMKVKDQNGVIIPMPISLFSMIPKIMGREAGLFCVTQVRSPIGARSFEAAGPRKHFARLLKVKK